MKFGRVRVYIGSAVVLLAIVALALWQWKAFARFAITAAAGSFAQMCIRDRYWINAWVGYAINMLCVPALALAGSWPAAAGLLIGERVGRGIRKPDIAATLSEAGRHRCV